MSMTKHLKLSLCKSNLSYNNNNLVANLINNLPSLIQINLRLLSSCRLRMQLMICSLRNSIKLNNSKKP